jgi:hypothetical protein
MASAETCSASTDLLVTLSCVLDPPGVIISGGPDPDAGIVGDFQWCCTKP